MKKWLIAAVLITLPISAHACGEGTPDLFIFIIVIVGFVVALPILTTSSLILGGKRWLKNYKLSERDNQILTVSFVAEVLFAFMILQPMLDTLPLDGFFNLLTILFIITISSITAKLIFWTIESQRKNKAKHRK